MPLVSVIIPYFKKKNYIKDAVNSILEQTFKNIEIIIIYDDENLSDYYYLMDIYKNKKNIKIFKNLKNIGAGLSRNIGIKKSNGEIIAFLDSDDIWRTNKLEDQLNFMIKNDYEFTFSNYEKKLLNGNTLKVVAKKEFDYDDLLKSCDIGLSTVMLNKKIIKENLFPNLVTKEDYVAWLNITKSNIKAHNVEKNLVIWKQVKNSLSSNFLQKFFDGFRVYYIYEKFNLIKSIFFLIRLSVNSLKRKI